MEPNFFAAFMTFSWPVVAIWLFSTRPLNKALIWPILGAYLILPVGYVVKFEMIPAFDKYSVSNVCAVIGSMFVSGRIPRLFSKFGVADALILLSLVSPFLTAAFNPDPLTIGKTLLPAEDAYDAGSAL